jgi:hypothetical protein
MKHTLLQIARTIYKIVLQRLAETMAIPNVFLAGVFALPDDEGAAE